MDFAEVEHAGCERSIGVAVDECIGNVVGAAAAARCYNGDLQPLVQLGKCVAGISVASSIVVHACE